MKKVVLIIDDILHPFYEKIGKQAGKVLEEVMSDALFGLVGKLSYEATAVTEVATETATVGAGTNSTTQRSA